LLEIVGKADCGACPYQEAKMLFLFIGVVTLTMKYMEWGPVAGWDWWVVLSPFALAALWWGWSDASGRTKRKVMEREDKRKQARIDKQRDAMGLPPKRPR
jgi:small Trp-rich protein